MSVNPAVCLSLVTHNVHRNLSFHKTNQYRLLRTTFLANHCICFIDIIPNDVSFEELPSFYFIFHTDWGFGRLVILDFIQVRIVTQPLACSDLNSIELSIPIRRSHVSLDKNT